MMIAIQPLCREPGCNRCERCTYCGRLLNHSGKGSKLNCDHVLSCISGGKTVVPVCERCNKSKSAYGLKEWLKWVRDNKTSLWKKIVDGFQPNAKDRSDLDSIQ